jgi:sigma-E factor negative regulatory protein RseC
MIEQNVQVIRCKNKMVWVRVGSQTGCTACDKGQGCGAGVFAKLLQRRPVEIQLADPENRFRVGQMVTLSFPEQLYLKMVMINYAWPLLAALAGGWLIFSVANYYQISAGWLDAVTLAGALLAAKLMMRISSKRNAPESVLDEMKMAACKPSATPGMCQEKPQDA